ncbi:MAG: c-type cytochrome [Gammaproteobacteria bacterium]|nr:c-type cytochrome [Gammaproteobacteria bacterium]
MKTSLYIIPLLLTIALPALAADDDRLLRRASRYFEPLPETMPGAENDNDSKIALGKKLYFDARLSINDSQSCASCHRLENGGAGVDNLPTSPGAKGQSGTRNSPTVLNAGWQRLQFWDGRAKDLVEQAKGPILNPIEMGMPDEQSVETKIRGITDYQSAFNTAYPDARPAITYQNIAEAIAAFERTLRTPSRFDDYLNGDNQALTENERQGLATFIKADCVSCHDGKLIGGEALEKLGKKNPYDNQSDQGLYTLTREESDRMVFKVPSLRNASLTAPYFHDGKINTLEEAVRLMGKLQLDITLSENEINDIVSFINALTDKKREK